jgi:tetratricopeptide (TPR) repeat protein
VSVLRPEDLLEKAMQARTPEARERWARRGLAVRSPLDKTLQTLLLRQLSLAHFERRRFDRALEVARQGIELGVLADVLHQDAARAAFAASDVDGAVAHLRMASRRAPASRRSFHLWTLGSVLFHAHRYGEAVAVLERAVRWATHDKPLCRAHLALAHLATGEPVSDLQATIDDLAAAPAGQGYGRFVLGHLAYATGAWRPARRYLEAFVRRVESGRAPVRIALEAETAMARATLSKMSAKGTPRDA